MPDSADSETDKMCGQQQSSYIHTKLLYGIKEKNWRRHAQQRSSCRLDCQWSGGRIVEKKKVSEAELSVLMALAPKTAERGR